MPLSLDEQRQMLVDRIASAGLRDPLVLRALRRVPREAFLPDAARDQAYVDRPAQVGAGHRTLSMSGAAALLEALGPEPGERILVVGGTGYVEALLACIAREVVGIIHEGDLASTVRSRLGSLGFRVQIVHGDGSRGWPPGAPWDRIVVEAGAPRVPPELLAQLREGGRLLTATGTEDQQHLQRITRQAPAAGGARYSHEDLGEVRMVPLQGEAAFAAAPTGPWDPAPPLRLAQGAQHLTTAEVIAQTAEPIDDLEMVSLDPLMGRVRGARVVLLGESFHGSREQARMRARISQALIEGGTEVVALQADPSDAARIDAYVRGRTSEPWRPASRVAAWQWHTEELRPFVEWLRAYNASWPEEKRVEVVGLDRLGLVPSIDALLLALDELDPEAAHQIEDRVACLTPFERCAPPDPTPSLQRALDTLEPRMLAAMQDALRARLQEAARHGDTEAVAGLEPFVAQASQVYRGLYRDDLAMWPAIDAGMVARLQQVLRRRGAGARAVVWGHNRNIGGPVIDANEATLGARCAAVFGEGAVYRVGMLSHHGAIFAASGWAAAPGPVIVPTSHPDSYEALLHTAGQPGLFLPLKTATSLARERLLQPRLERIVGVVYRPGDEPRRHYVRAVLAEQFDEVVWFDETHPVQPIGTPRPLERLALVGG